jgi:REP element-mobilizing transposase RayT
MRQMKFEFFRSSNLYFGGEYLEGHRKTQRPLSVKTPLHLVLKSETQRIFQPQIASLRRLILETAWKFEITIRELAVSWNHIHLIIQIKDRKDYVRFIRALTPKLAQAARNVNPKAGKLFSLRPYSRIVSWGRDFENAIEYLYKNIEEAFGRRRPDKIEKNKRKRRRDFGSA